MSMPNWVTFDISASKITGKAPLVDQSTNYTFYVKSTWTENFLVNVQKPITIHVKNVENIENDETVENVEATTAGTVAVVGTQAVVVVVVGFTLISSLISNNSTSSIWSFVNQLQMITLLMLTDSFTPQDFIDYIEGNSYVNFNLDFIPLKDIPYLNWPTDESDVKLDDMKLNAYGIHSRSAFVNLFSIMIVFIIVFLTYLLLLLLPNEETETA
jgi:hypothetical protein